MHRVSLLGRSGSHAVIIIIISDFSSYSAGSAMRAVEVVAGDDIFDGVALHGVHVLAWWHVGGFPHPLLLLLGVGVRAFYYFVRRVDVQLSDSFLLLYNGFSSRSTKAFHNLIQLTGLLPDAHLTRLMSLFRAD